MAAAGQLGVAQVFHLLAIGFAAGRIGRRIVLVLEGAGDGISGRVEHGVRGRPAIVGGSRDVPLLAVGTVAVHVVALAVVPKRQLGRRRMVGAGDVRVPRREARRAGDVCGAGSRRRQHGLALGVEAGVDHPRGGVVRPGDAGLEIVAASDVLAELEVAVDHGNLHRVADRRLRAGPTGLDLAVL